MLLLKRGLWPPRRGDAPHCRECDYNLTGLTSENCPECGQLLTANHIVTGQRRKRIGLIIVGTLCILPILLAAPRFLTKANWYRLKPTAWVIDDLQSTTQATARGAWFELDRRTKTTQLSPEHHNKLVTVCLEEQSRPERGTVNFVLSDCVDFLGDAHLRQRLSQEQTDTFFEQIIQTKLQVRHEIAPGEKVPYQLTAHGRNPGVPWWTRIDDRRILVDGMEVQGDVGSSTFSGTGGTISRSGSVACPGPGRHNLTTVATLYVYTGPNSDTPASTLRHQREIRRHADFTVLETEPDDYFKLVDNPQLAEQIHDCIDIRKLNASQSMAGHISVDMSIAPLPTNVAFDVIFRMDGRETAEGGFTRRQGEPLQNTFYHVQYNGVLPKTLDLILRSSEKRARETVDVFEIWNGELIFENIPFESDLNHDAE